MKTGNVMTLQTNDFCVTITTNLDERVLLSYDKYGLMNALARNNNTPRNKYICTNIVWHKSRKHGCSVLHDKTLDGL